MFIRNSTRAIIVNDQAKILCLKMRDGNQRWYMTPGGGQNPGESLADALKRECLEEIGAQIVVHDLMFVQDYIGRSRKDPNQHHVEFCFRCTLVDGEEPKIGSVPDDMQVGLEWIELSRLNECEFYPHGLKKALTDKDSPIYLGDVD